MTESRNFYLNASSELKDWLLNCHEKGVRLFDIKSKLKEVLKRGISSDSVKEALIMSYIDSGESGKAVDLACQFNEQEPTANMHNLILKALLSSWQFSQQAFFDESKAWAERWAGLENTSLKAYHNQKPRIGFVCDYGSTVFGENAIFPMCLAFIQAGFDVHYYNFEEAHFNVRGVDLKVANVHKLNSHQLSTRILQDKIDVLVDLNGRLRDNHRLGVFTCRSAPVQLNYFNLVGTTGMTCYDYAIVDEIQVPRIDERFYTEKIIRLPCGVNGAFSFKRDVPIAPRISDENRIFTFASFNAFFKCNDLLLRTWAEILRRVPNSRLIIKCHETSRDRVIKKIAHVFSSEGVDFERIMIEGWSSLQTLRKQYAHVDLCLDTFPYSGGSSTLNSLWQGVPVLTWCGDGWRARSTASILSASGLAELIASSREEYIEKAEFIGRNHLVLSGIREKLIASLDKNYYFRPDDVYKELAGCVKSVVRKSESMAS